jgi:hypothetical protein
VRHSNPAESGPTDRAGTAVTNSNQNRSLDNKLLATLPRAHFELLVPHLETVSLPQCVTLSEPDD